MNDNLERIIQDLEDQIHDLEIVNNGLEHELETRESIILELRDEVSTLRDAIDEAYRAIRNYT